MAREAPNVRVAARFLTGSYFSVGDLVYFGKYKNHVGKVVAFGADQWGNPTIEIEPIPKGRKQNKVMGLFKIWRKDVKDKALAERAEQAASAAGGAVAAAPFTMTDDDEEDDDDDDDAEV